MGTTKNPKESYEGTPFSLVYKSEAVTPTEIAVASYITIYLNQTLNTDERYTNLDLDDEKH